MIKPVSQTIVVIKAGVASNYCKCKPRVKLFRFSW